MNLEEAEDEYQNIQAVMDNAFRHFMSTMAEFEIPVEAQSKLIAVYHQGIVANKQVAVADLILGMAGQSPAQNQEYIEREVRSRNLGRVAG